MGDASRMRDRETGWKWVATSRACEPHLFPPPEVNIVWRRLGVAGNGVDQAATAVPAFGLGQRRTKVPLPEAIDSLFMTGYEPASRDPETVSTQTVCGGDGGRPVT